MMILINPEWDWETTRNVNYSIEKMLYERYGVGLDSVTVVRATSPDWRAHVLSELTFMPTRYRNIDRKSIRAWLWRFFGRVFRKPCWVRRGQDSVILEPKCDHEEKIELLQWVAEASDGTRYRWYMGYGPRSKCLAIGAWKGSTGFVQSQKKGE